MNRKLRSLCNSSASATIEKGDRLVGLSLSHKSFEPSSRTTTLGAALQIVSRLFLIISSTVRPPIPWKMIEHTLLNPRFRSYDRVWAANFLRLRRNECPNTSAPAFSFAAFYDPFDIEATLNELIQNILKAKKNIIQIIPLSYIRKLAV